jgi:hypothetical protein
MKTEPTDFTFPSYNPDNGNGCAGLTKREYFAGIAMQGLLAHYLSENVTGWDMKTYAVESVALADALIAELNTPA